MTSQNITAQRSESINLILNKIDKLPNEIGQPLHITKNGIAENSDDKNNAKYESVSNTTKDEVMKPSKIKSKTNVRQKCNLKATHVCKECGDVYHNRGHLLRHMKSHERQDIYPCHLCKKTYSTNYLLKRHITTHFGGIMYDKKFTCDHCGNSFTSSSHLTVHLRTHTGEKPFVCDKCEKAFIDKSTWQRHVKTVHGGEKPYVCHACGKCFTQSGHLKAHILTHSAEKPYFCTLCPKKYSDPRMLKRHQKTHVNSNSKMSQVEASVNNINCEKELSESPKGLSIPKVCDESLKGKSTQLCHSNKYRTADVADISDSNVVAQSNQNVLGSDIHHYQNVSQTEKNTHVLSQSNSLGSNVQNLLKVLQSETCVSSAIISSPHVDVQSNSQTLNGLMMYIQNLLLNGSNANTVKSLLETVSVNDCSNLDKISLLTHVSNCATINVNEAVSVNCNINDNLSNIPQNFLTNDSFLSRDMKTNGLEHLINATKVSVDETSNIEETMNSVVHKYDINQASSKTECDSYSDEVPENTIPGKNITLSRVHYSTDTTDESSDTEDVALGKLDQLILLDISEVATSKKLISSQHREEANNVKTRSDTVSKDVSHSTNEGFGDVISTNIHNENDIGFKPQEEHLKESETVVGINDNDDISLYTGYKHHNDTLTHAIKVEIINPEDDFFSSFSQDNINNCVNIEKEIHDNNLMQTPDPNHIQKNTKQIGEDCEKERQCVVEGHIEKSMETHHSVKKVEKHTKEVNSKSNMIMDSNITLDEQILEFCNDNQENNTVIREFEGKSEINIFNSEEKQDINPTKRNQGKTKICYAQNKSNNKASKQVPSKNKSSTHVKQSNKTISCETCGKQFKTLAYLLVHNRTHTGEKPCICQICNKGFADHSTLNRHLTVHTGIKNYICSKCGKSFAQSGHLQSHMAVHATEKLYQCDHCDKTFANKRNLTRHLNRHTTAKKQFICEKCPKTFTNINSLKSHYVKHGGPKRYTCDTCGKPFLYEFELKRHQVTHSEEKPFSCKLCDKKYKAKRYLTIHMMDHTGERPFICDCCGKGFTQRRNLESHKFVHVNKNLENITEEVQEQLRKKEEHAAKRRCVCSVCDQVCRDKAVLKLHMRSHTGERPYKCEQCDKGFANNYRLKVHMLTHSAIKPFICPQCGKGFTQNCHLSAHSLIHETVTPFQCTQCDKYLASAASLEGHMRTHSGEKPYECSLCFKKFSQKSNWSAHQSKHLRTKEKNSNL